MSGEVFRRVGRGGAGNWYSKKDVEDADKLVDEEAQRPKAPSPLPGDLSGGAPPSSSYARAGRGGAGNFYAADSVAASTAERQDETARLQAAVNSSTTTTTNQQHRPMALSGRGGAGNWVSGGASTEATERTEEGRKQAELEARIRQDVEAGLAMPAPAYHGAEARVGKKGPGVIA